MNLLEMSDCLGKPIDELRNLLQEQFNRIVLSEYSQLDEKVVKGLLNYLNIDEGIIGKNEAKYKESRVTSSKKKASLADNSHIKKDVKRHSQQPVGTRSSYIEENKCGSKSLLSDDVRLLQELNEIEFPEVSYTKKLIKYCFENNYLIFVDTCSLLNDYFYDFFILFSEACEEPYILYIPYVVIEELKSIIKNRKKEQSILKKAEDRIGFILQQCQINTMKIVGDESDKRTNEYGKKVIHADRVLIEKLIYFRNDSKSCMLITQDYGVTVDALKQNEWQSTKSQAQIVVKKIGKGGTLVDNSEDIINPTLPIN